MGYRFSAPKKRIRYIHKRLEEMRDILELNYTDNSVFVTLTFKDVTSIEDASKSFRKFRIKFKEFALSGYVYVVELHPDGHGAHIHAVFFSVPYVKKDVLAQVWGKGFVDISKIKSKVAVSKYISKYFAPQFNCVRVFYQSKGLLKPFIFEKTSSFDLARHVFKDTKVKIFLKSA